MTRPPWTRLGAGLMLLAGCVHQAAVRPEAPRRRVTALADSIPFTLTLRQTSLGSSLSAVHSYRAVSVGGRWLVFGGRRRQGLHTFLGAPAANFPRDSANDTLQVVDPASGQVWKYPLSGIRGTVGAMLAATNQESWHDRAADRVYLVGGYGWNAARSDMYTFPYLAIFSPTRVISAVIGGASADSIAALFTLAQHDSLAVTGGELSRLNGFFHLVFGQRFDGQYRAFAGQQGAGAGGAPAELPFRQAYTNEIRRFLVSETPPYQVRFVEPYTIGDTAQSFHRRDGNTVEDVDPATGRLRVAAFGGVFRPGVIAPYGSPVYLDGLGAPRVDRGFSQTFNQYECPVIGVYSAANAITYHAFVGGIGGTYLTQTQSQQDTFALASAQGRNDGLPFVADISVVSLDSSGRYQERVLLQPTPDTALIGASARFIPNDSLRTGGAMLPNGLLNLDAFPTGRSVLVGWIYGGIKADNPLPAVPNFGTHATSTVYEVWIGAGVSMPAVPASAGHPARTGPPVTDRQRRP